MLHSEKNKNKFLFFHSFALSLRPKGHEDRLHSEKNKNKFLFFSLICTIFVSK